MQAYKSYEGYIKDGCFLPMGIMPHIHEGMKAIITVLNEPANESKPAVRPPMQFDCLKGVLIIDDDFDDVLADFEGYM